MVVRRESGMMNVTPRLVLVAAILLAAGGCRSSRPTVTLDDLIRNMDAQDAAAAPALTTASDTPDAPVAKVADSELASLEALAGTPGSSGFEPLDLHSGGALTIQADSVLRITVQEDPGLSGSYPVNSLGGIQFSYIGPVILDNLTEPQAAEKIRQILLNREFQSATITVKILRPSYDRVRIAGGVRRPGEIKVGAGDEVTLNSALNQVGGIIDEPWNTQVKVVRGGLTSIMAAYLPGEVYSLVDDKKRPYVPDVKLRNNDVVFVYGKSAAATRSGVRTRPRYVLVLGEVGQPGFYRFDPSERFTMMNLIFRMGSLPAYANDKGVRVIRQSDSGSEEEFKVNVREIMKEGNPELDFPLMSGDRIIVPARRISLF
jgi:protein involved in polysaccharide export with SLBB domain